MAKTKKTQIREDLEEKMRRKNLTSALYASQLAQYMTWYDQLQDLNRVAENSKDNPRLRLDCLKEGRQLQKAMQGILKDLGIDPAEESAGEDDYDL